MLSPRHGYRVSMLGLGTSVGTPPEGITAQVRHRATQLLEASYLSR
jgi:hypothetical protein